MLWDYSKKEEYNNTINEWHLTFKLSNLNRRNFLQLLNNNLSEIEPACTKGGPWLKHFGFSNSLCAQATWAITNHTPIGEYCFKFFLREEFKCPCGSYPIESRQHILYKCRQFNRYWNLMRQTMNYFISFLEFNPGAFSFRKGITWVSFQSTLVELSSLFVYSSFLCFSFFFLFLF